jgi:hypothetical protein
MLRPIVATLAVCVAMLAVCPTSPARAALQSAWPADVVNADRFLQTARSFRVISAEGGRQTVVEVQHPDRERIALNGQTIVRIGDRVWLKNPGEAWKDVSSAGTGRIALLGALQLPPNAYVLPEGAGSDGVAPAHMYHIIYPGGSPEVRWYVRVSDGRLHLIRRAGKSGPVSATIDQYDRVPAIDPPR